MRYPFDLLDPNHQRHGLYEYVTGTQSHSLRRALLEIMYEVVYGHDEAGLRREDIELGIDSLYENEDEVTRHVVATQRVVAAVEDKVAVAHLVLDDLPEIEVDIRLDAESKVEVETIKGAGMSS